MKKFLLCLTLFFASHHAHGAKVSDEASNNLWYSIVAPSQCNPQNMTPQEALDACKQEDALFSFDTFILTIRTRNTHNTLLHCTVGNHNLEQVQFIFEHITDETKSTLAFRVNQNLETPFILALQKDDKTIINYMLAHVNDRIRNSLLLFALEKKNTPMIIQILQHESFDPIARTVYIQNLIQNDIFNGQLKQALIQLIENNKCKSDTLVRILLTLLKEIHAANQKIDEESLVEHNDLIQAILTNENFDKDDALKYFIENFNLPGIEWLFTKFPDYQDDGYINVLIKANVIEQNELNIIEFLINHGITNISPKHYNDLTNETSDLNVSFDLNKLTINSWTPARSLSLKTIGIATILYDFIKFKKPEKVTDDKKDSKAKITEKPGIKKDIKKAAIKHDKKESKEKQKRSLLKRLVKHTHNYVKDLKNLRNHKKLAIPVACVLLRFLKDKTPLKWY